VKIEDAATSNRLFFKTEFPWQSYINFTHFLYSFSCQFQQTHINFNTGAFLIPPVPLSGLIPRT